MGAGGAHLVRSSLRIKLVPSRTPGVQLGQVGLRVTLASSHTPENFPGGTLQVAWRASAHWKDPRAPGEMISVTEILGFFGWNSPDISFLTYLAPRTSHLW